MLYTLKATELKWALYFPDLLRDYDFSEDPNEDDDDEHDGGWLFEIQDLNGKTPTPKFMDGVVLFNINILLPVVFNMVSKLNYT